MASATAAGSTTAGIMDLAPLFSQVGTGLDMAPGQLKYGLLGLATGAIAGYNAFFFGAMICDGLAQLTGCISDCVYHPEKNQEKSCSCACDRSGPAESRYCDCIRTLLFGFCPGMLGGAIELGLWGGDFLFKLEDLLFLLAGYTLPDDFGWTFLATNVLNLVVNFPLAFCLHDKPVNSLRFLTASATALGIRSIFAIDCLIINSFATWVWITTQALSYWAFSLILYSDSHPSLDAKIFTGDTLKKMLNNSPADETAAKEIIDLFHSFRDVTGVSTPETPSSPESLHPEHSTSSAANPASSSDAPETQQPTSPENYPESTKPPDTSTAAPSPEITNAKETTLTNMATPESAPQGIGPATLEAAQSPSEANVNLEDVPSQP